MIQSSGTLWLKTRDMRTGCQSRRAPVALARLAHVVLEHVEEIGPEGGAVGVQRGHPRLVARGRGQRLRDDRLRPLARPARLRLHLDLQRRHLAGAPTAKILRRPRVIARACSLPPPPRGEGARGWGAVASKCNASWPAELIVETEPASRAPHPLT